LSRAEARPDAAGDHGSASTTARALRKEQPTAGIVHDLGNLIQVASSALNHVARHPSVSNASALEPAIASAKTALQRAGALVRETIGAREALREIECVNVGICLSEIETLVRSAWDPSVRLEFRIEPGVPAIKCNRLGLQNAVLNLVFNAHDAMPDGGSILIEVAAAVEGRADQIEFRVADSGIGMTQDTIARAFDSFFTTKCQGLGGIGLPMVRHFAEQHGGTVEIESALGSGTTVILRLPAALSDAGAGLKEDPHA
jgi:signal transduction histidine kinase